MPATSQAQRQWAFANKGPAWAKRHHFDNKGPLPARAPKRKGGQARDQLIRQFVTARNMEKARGRQKR